MHLCYFDESKPSKENDNFFIGGLLINEIDALECEKKISQIAANFFGSSVTTVFTELHGKDLFHGKGNCKGKTLTERVAIFVAVTDLITNHSIPVRMVCINVKTHESKYINPYPSYKLGLMLILERFCRYLDKIQDLGVAFGDYEADEITKAIVDFSGYKSQGSTPMYFGRSLESLIDTVYFTHSHHSRFLQIADMLVYMAGRFENSNREAKKWHEIEVKKCWEKIKTSVNFEIKHWP